MVNQYLPYNYFLGPLESKDVIEGELNQSTEESGDELVVSKKLDVKNSRKLKRSIQQSGLSFENELHPSKRQKELSQTVSQIYQKSAIIEVALFACLKG